MWHVLEHVYQLNDYLKKIRNQLAKDGVLIVAVPNPESYDAMYYKQYWAAYDLPLPSGCWSLDARIAALLSARST